MSTIRFSSAPTRPGSGGALFGRVLTGLLAVALAAFAGCATKEGGSPDAGAGAIGSPAPDFALPDLEGNIVRRSDFEGKVVILDFWATWCAPCRREVPHFVRLQSKYRDQGLAIVGLSLDAGGARDVRPFAEEFDVNYTMLIADEKTANDFGGIIGIPTTFVVDREGKVVKRFIGETGPEVFEETIRPLLATSS